MTAVNAAFVVFLLCAAASRWLISRSMGSLTVEQKALIVDASANRRPWFFIVLAALVAGWTFAFGHIHNKHLALIGFIIILVLVGILSSAARVRRLSRMGLPPPYLRSLRASLSLIVFGLLFMVAMMIYSEWPHHVH